MNRRDERIEEDPKTESHTLTHNEDVRNESYIYLGPIVVTFQLYSL